MLSHLAVIACLMGEMAERGVDYRDALSRIEIEPKKAQGAAARGKFAGDHQTDMFAGAGPHPPNKRDWTKVREHNKNEMLKGGTLW